MFTELLMTNFAFVLLTITSPSPNPLSFGPLSPAACLTAACIGSSSPVQIYVSDRCKIFFLSKAASCFPCLRLLRPGYSCYQLITRRIKLPNVFGRMFLPALSGSYIQRCPESSGSFLYRITNSSLSHVLPPHWRHHGWCHCGIVLRAQS